MKQKLIYLVTLDFDSYEVEASSKEEAIKETMRRIKEDLESGEIERGLCASSSEDD